jgi:hypothetical protein
MPVGAYKTKRPETTVTYAQDLKWEPVGPLDENGRGIFVCLLYGDLKKKGPTHFLMKYSAGVRAPSHSHSGDYYAVVVSGRIRHFIESENEYRVLTSGSAWFQRGNVPHQDHCVGPDDCILAIFWPQGFDVTPQWRRRRREADPSATRHMSGASARERSGPLR